MTLNVISLKDKIAESLIQDELKLQGSFFGHFFIRKVNLPLYKRNKYDWKEKQARGVGGTPAELHAQQAQQQSMPAHRLAAQAAVSAHSESAPSAEASNDQETGKKKRKNKAGGADEIDEIFGGATKKGKLSAGVVA